ncbi:hypothetical protein Ahy_B08g090759 [Arachis hypogaea]|uniref:Protein FAR1-RELATED SEQUENCE n=1 Tax=Arachis hypogaea TaxID=3818 RepID=A0A444Y0L0_ARAHY|nr:hypothetical protein Ahy_B08g090759 [Arachis hypogaea]
MNHVVWNLFTKDAFDRNWNDFVTKFGLRGNKWLSGNRGFNSNYFHAVTLWVKTCTTFGLTQLMCLVHYAKLYKDRHIWIPIYLDHHFWDEMRSTQRSESMHTFFNKFITCNSSLSQSVKQYDNCLASREQRERELDAADFHTMIPYATKLAIKAQFQHVYTHEKFREVQGHFRRKSRSKRFDDLVFWLHNICKFTSETEELIGFLHQAFDNVMAEMQEYQARSKEKSSLSHEEATLSDVNDLQSPYVSEQEAGPRTDWDQTRKERSQTPRRKRKTQL